MLTRSGVIELPQFFDVVRGEMSLVGLRPGAFAGDPRYEAAISEYARHNHIKLGITGWAQVNGLLGARDSVDGMDRQIQLDVWYIENQSLILDFKIIWRTCFALTRNTA